VRRIKTITSLTATKNCTTSNSAQTCVTARCDVGAFLIQAECKTV